MKFEKRQIKKPSTKGYSKKYPMFAFRIPQNDKAETTLKRVQANLEALYEHLKAKATDDQKIINKNDLILEALDRGLIELKGEHR